MDETDFNTKEFSKGIHEVSDSIHNFRNKNLRNIKLQITLYFIDLLMVIASIILFFKGYYLYAIILFIAGFPEIEKWAKLFKLIQAIRKARKMLKGLSLNRIC